MQLVVLSGCSGAMSCALTKREVKIRVPGSNKEVLIRGQSADYSTYRQVFVGRQYDFPGLPNNPKTIVDLGANIGFASIFFAMKYPEALIHSVEPFSSNFALLKKNVCDYARIITHQCAIMSEDNRVVLASNKQGCPENACQFKFAQGNEHREPECFSGDEYIPCFSLENFLNRHEVDHVDILKMDIEGHENDVFQSADTWMPRCDVILVESHDNLVPNMSSIIKESARSNGYHCVPFGEGFAITKGSTVKLSS
jgi:FkbM family methyltransferase